MGGRTWTQIQPVPDFGRFQNWVDRGLAGEMRYLADYRADVRSDPARLIARTMRSIICVGLVYNGPQPYSTQFTDPERAWISRYAWGEDYHKLLRAKLDKLNHKLLEIEEFSSRICVDTAPLLERSLARRAGLGWIGKNTCLINQKLGSWFFLGELLTTLAIEPRALDCAPPDRCGTCTRCIDACPTDAIVPSPDGRFELDSRLCISYFTIELRTAIPEAQRPALGAHIFGCDAFVRTFVRGTTARRSTNEPGFSSPGVRSLELERRWLELPRLSSGTCFGIHP